MICVLWDIGVQLHSFACGHSAIPAPFVEKTIPLSLNCLLIPIKNHLITNWSIYYLNSQLYIIDLVSTFTLIPCRLDYCCFVVNFEIRKYESFNFPFFFPQNSIGYTGSPGFPHQFKDQVVNSCKEGSWDFDRDYIDPVGQFEESF